MENRMKEIIQTSGEEISILSLLDSDERKRIMECFRVVRYSANTVCFRESDRMDFIGIIASGKMEVKTQSDLAGTYVLLGVLGKGAHIGDFSILRDRPSFGTVTTLEETELLVITHDELEAFPL